MKIRELKENEKQLIKAEEKHHGRITPQIYKAKISNVKIWTDKWSRATAIILDNNLIEDFSFQVKWEKYHGIKNLFLCSVPQKIKFIKGVTADLNAIAGYNYYHWLFHVLPKFSLITEKVDNYLIYEFSKDFQKQSLEMLNIPLNKIISTKDNRFLKCEKLITFSYNDVFKPVPKWALSFIRKLRKNHKPSKRIFVSRKDAKTRKIINENEIFSYLKNLGFEKFTGGDLSLEDQINLFSKAEIVIMPYGAAGANTIFCNKNTKIIELFNPNFISNEYKRIAEFIGAKYIRLIGEDKIIKARRDVRQDKNIKINLKKIKKVLNKNKIYLK